VFSYRLLRIARADQTPLAGFDENAWTRAAPHAGRRLADIADELIAVRRATMALVASLDEAGRKSTTIARKLRDVEALPEDEADRLLTLDEPGVIDLDTDEPAEPQLAEPPVH